MSFLGYVNADCIDSAVTVPPRPIVPLNNLYGSIIKCA